MHRRKTLEPRHAFTPSCQTLAGGSQVRPALVRFAAEGSMVSKSRSVIGISYSR